MSPRGFGWRWRSGGPRRSDRRPRRGCGYRWPTVCGWPGKGRGVCGGMGRGAARGAVRGALCDAWGSRRAHGTGMMHPVRSNAERDRQAAGRMHVLASWRRGVSGHGLRGCSIVSDEWGYGSRNLPRCLQYKRACPDRSGPRSRGGRRAGSPARAVPERRVPRTGRHFVDQSS